MVPLCTWLKLLLRVRAIAEHYALSHDHMLTKTRTTVPNLFDRLFVAPYSVGYHMEHHLYPSVPFFRLRRLHRLCLADPVFREKAHVTRGYWNVLQECLTSPRAVPAEMTEKESSHGQ
jgi:fatty acid desaturase